MDPKTSWGYNNTNGPHTWCLGYPDAAGKRQSPINLDSSIATFDEKLAKQPLKYFNSVLAEYTLENTGLSFKFTPESHNSTVTGGPLCSDYKLEQLHMHWGNTDCVGSEHSLNGKFYPAELHLVHWDAKRRQSFGEATHFEDGLCVLGSLIEIGPPNPQLQRMLDNFAAIASPNSTASITNCQLDLVGLMPGNYSARYYTYAGSLTTPPCSECVRWIVFEEPITASEEQLETLRSLESVESGKIFNNFRSQIPLGDRPLAVSFND